MPTRRRGARGATAVRTRATQHTLFDQPPTSPKLGDRQKLALALLEAAEPDGLTTDQLGARIHEHRGTHDHKSRCDWCESEGNDVLRSQGLKPLVVRRRADGRWHPRNPPSPPDDNGDIPF